MNDLNTIIANNARAVKSHIPKVLASGKHVVAQYAGLHFVDFTAHDTHEEAELAGNEYAAVSPDRSVRIYSPSSVTV